MSQICRHSLKSKKENLFNLVDKTSRRIITRTLIHLFIRAVSKVLHYQHCVVMSSSQTSSFLVLCNTNNHHVKIIDLCNNEKKNTSILANTLIRQTYS